jgi:hypothetical protein
MDDLIAFLRARLMEDEERVRALSEPHDWRTGPGDDPDWEDESTVYMWPPEFHTPYEEDKHWRGLTTYSPALAAFIARHDPARVLRGVEAQRRIVERYAWLREHGDTGDAAWVLPLLAAAYSDHPDYQERWRT